MIIKKQRKKNNVILLIFLSIIILSLSCNKNPIEPVKEYENDFEFIWEVVDNYYPFKEFKNINWNSLHSQYANRIKNINNNDSLKLIYISLLNELKDGHANLYNNKGYPEQGYKIPRMEKDKEAFDISIIKTYFISDFKEQYDFKYGRLNDSIGYIYYSRFSETENKYKIIDEIIDFLKDTKALIFDIRGNGGGNNISSYYIIKRMISSPLEGVLWTKKGGGFYPIETYYPEGKYQYTKPIVLLINGACFSSAEGFANL